MAELELLDRERRTTERRLTNATRGREGLFRYAPEALPPKSYYPSGPQVAPFWFATPVHFYSALDNVPADLRDHRQTAAPERELQPSIVINHRTDAPADFLLREGDEAMGNFENRYPCELCATLTTGTWGYQPNAKIKSRDDMIRLLVGAVVQDANLLLNVGPRPDGQIEPEQAERLHKIGDWLKQFGQSIYSTRGGPYLPGDFGVSTDRDRSIYLHIPKLNG